MENFKKKCIVFILASCIFSPLFSQVDHTGMDKPRKNSIGLYFGMIEYNINYERNIIQRPKSQSNIRLGFGYLTDLQVEGRTINATIVQLLGKKNSYLELNLGVKYFFDKQGKDNFFLPEVYAGYRYNKPDGRLIFRLGLSYPSFVNIGIGMKL